MNIKEDEDEKYEKSMGIIDGGGYGSFTDCMLRRNRLCGRNGRHEEFRAGSRDRFRSGIG